MYPKNPLEAIKVVIVFINEISYSAQMCKNLKKHFIFKIIKIAVYLQLISNPNLQTLFEHFFLFLLQKKNVVYTLFL